jgi:hypothetical protein
MTSAVAAGAETSQILMPGAGGQAGLSCKHVLVPERTSSTIRS